MTLSLTVLSAEPLAGSLGGPSAPASAPAGYHSPGLLPGSAPKYVLDDAQRARIAALVDEISELDQAQLDAAALQRGGEPSVDLVLAVLLRAGRPMPPGLSSARRTQREERSNEALSWIRVALASPKRAALVGDAISAALRIEAPAPELSAAAMAVVARLDLVGHALEVARWLEPVRPEPGPDARPALGPDAGAPSATHRERLRIHAQVSLYRLYGRWFEDVDGFRAQWEILRGRSPEGTGRTELLAALGTAQGRALRLIEFAPRQLDHDLLQWPLPQMRADAASALGRAVAAGTMPPDEARTILARDLAAERSELALAARLQTLLDLIQGADPAGGPARDVRALVFDVAELASSRSCEEMWVMIGALTRLMHAPGDAGDAARGETLQRGIDLFEQALARGQVRALDPDALQGAISGLSDLVRSIDDPKYATKAARPLAQLVRTFVVGESFADRRERTPLRVRRAAAEAFALSVDPSDAKDLVSVVRSMETPELEYELLGALRAVIAVVEPGDANAESVISELFEAAAEPKFDSRARALELLLSEDVRAALLATDRATEARWVEARLFAEPSVELRAQLVRLLGQVGDVASLARLVAPLPVASGVGAPTSNLDLLARSGEPLIPAVAQLVTELSADRPELRLRAAYALAGEEPAVGSTDPLLPLRTRAGLDLLLATDLRALGDPSQAAVAERWILATAIQQRRTLAAPTAAFFSSSEPASLRLREIVEHRTVEESSGAELATQDLVEAQLASALMRSDLMRASVEAGVLPTSAAAQNQSISEILQRFDGAIQAAPVQGWTGADLILESVALLRAHGRQVEALQRLERLVMAGDPPPTAADLSAESIRTFAQLVAAPEVDAIRNLGRGARASRLLLDVLSRPSWRKDSVEERFADMEQLLFLRGLVTSKEALLQAIDERVLALSGEEALREEFNAVDADRAEKLWSSVPVATQAAEADGESVDGAGEEASGDEGGEPGGDPGGEAAGGAASDAAGDAAKQVGEGAPERS